MDHNHDSAWPGAHSEVAARDWGPKSDGTDNALQSPPFGSSIPAMVTAQPPARQEVIVRERRDASVSNRYGYLFVLSLGLFFSLLAVVISTRVLPRYLDVQRRYGFVLPAETTLALRSGMVQPIPGCALILAGLTGLLARRPSRRHAVVTAILLLAALALPLLTAAALLTPELTLV